MYVDPSDLEDLGPMPQALRDRLMDRFTEIIRRRPEYLDHLRACAGEA